MNSALIPTLQEIIHHELRAVRVTELGVVTAIFPHPDAGDDDNSGVDVTLKASGLALSRVPVATGHIGSVAIPNVGDLVLVAFDRGDVNQPIVIGRLYDDVARAPLNHSDELIFRLPLAEADDRTIKGAIRVTDGDPLREIVFEMPPKITVRITDGTVRATAGATEMVLDQPDDGGGTVTVLTGRTKLVMHQDGDVDVEAAQAVSLKATSNLSLEGVDVSIKATGNVSVEANGSATLRASGMTTVQASGPATLQGSVVAIKGVTSFSP